MIWKKIFQSSNMWDTFCDTWAINIQLWKPTGEWLFKNIGFVKLWAVRMYFHTRSSALIQLILSLVISCSSVKSLNWQENVRPKLFAQLTSRDYQSFVGTVVYPDQITESGKKLLRYYIEWAYFRQVLSISLCNCLRSLLQERPNQKFQILIQWTLVKITLQLCFTLTTIR